MGEDRGMQLQGSSRAEMTFEFTPRKNSERGSDLHVRSFREGGRVRDGPRSLFRLVRLGGSAPYSQWAHNL